VVDLGDRPRRYEVVALVPHGDDEVALAGLVVRPLDRADGVVAAVDAVALDAVGMADRPLRKVQRSAMRQIVALWNRPSS
jgi:hypothetical protein